MGEHPLIREAKASCNLDGETMWMAACGHAVNGDTAYSRYDYEIICEECFHAHYAWCRKCQRAYKRPSVAGHKRLCPACAKEIDE